MSESVSLGRMHDTVGMFGWRVNREQLHNDIAGVDEVVFGSCRHGEQIAGDDVMVFPADDSLARPLNKHQLSIPKISSGA
jgi:hypothetical protein